MDVLKNIRDTFNSNFVSAIMSEKSAINSDNVLMKVKNDEHAEMKALLEDEWKIMEADDSTPPTQKTTTEERGVEGMPTNIPLQRHCLNEECHGCHLPFWQQKVDETSD